MLEPRRLLTFREVARHGSFSRAAEALNLSQPAVSQQITALETELGTQLLIRGRQGSTATPAGALLLQHADALAARLDLADRQLAALVREERRSLRVGAFPTALATIVAPALAAVRAGSPDAEIAVEEARLDALTTKVRSGYLHAAVLFQDSTGERREPDDTVRVDIVEEQFIALLAQDHPLAGREEIAIEELRDDPWMAPSADGIIVNACRRAGFEPNLTIVTRDPLAIRAIAAAGLAVTLSPGMLASLGMPGIAMVAVEDAPRRQVYALLPEAGRNALAERFVEALR